MGVDMEWNQYDNYTKRDIVKDILITIMMIAAFFAYWMFVILLLSLVLVNVWRIQIKQMILFAVLLTAVTSVVYIIRLIRKRHKEIY